MLVILNVSCFLITKFVWADTATSLLRNASLPLKSDDLFFAEDKFQAFLRQYNRKYADEVEREKRFSVFRENLKHVDRLQKDDRGTATYGITKFSDVSREEFMSIYGNIKNIGEDLRKDDVTEHKGLNITREHLFKPPRKFDWRERGFVNPPKNQGQCGACYAFASVGMFETLYSNRVNHLHRFSEQQIIDCSRNDGCENGNAPNSFSYMEQFGMLEENVYPYKGYDDICKDIEGHPFHKLTSHVIRKPSEGGEKEMVKIIPECPVVAAVDPTTLQQYTGGIAAPTAMECSREFEDTSHLLLAVGYGSEKVKIDGKKKKQRYFILKNSWGTDWGEGTESDGSNLVYSLNVIIP